MLPRFHIIRFDLHTFDLCMDWTWREYDPFRRETAERGSILPMAALELFRDYQWKALLTAMDERASEVQHAPGFEFVDQAGRVLYVGGAGDAEKLSFVAAYIRPKFIKRLTLLGFKPKLVPDHYSDTQVDRPAEIEEMINAFFEGRTEELESRFT